MVVTAWKLDLQLHVQLVFITTKSCEFEPCSWREYTLCDTVCQWLAIGRWCSPVFSTNKTEIVLKVAFNTIIPILNMILNFYPFIYVLESWTIQRRSSLDCCIYIYIYIIFYCKFIFSLNTNFVVFVDIIKQRKLRHHERYM